MMRTAHFLSRLRADEAGAMVVETALVAPVLVLLSLGAFQISGMVARQTELESAASEAAAIALAAQPDTAAKRTTLQQVIQASSNLPAASTGGTRGVQVTEVYRCGISTSYVTSETSCTSGQIARYVRIALVDTYTPAWTRFGVGSAITYRVTRNVMYKQEEVN
jgi:Flp pilus assembly protein TadG